MLLKKILLTSLLALVSIVSLAQRTTEEEYVESEKKKDSSERKTPFKDRLVFGGNLGGSFGSVSYFQVNPMVGYKTTDWWVNGVGLNYIYAGSRGYTQNIYGASVWSRAYVLENVMLHTEYEYLTMNLRAPNGESYSANAPVWLVGAGYQSNGNGFGLSFMLLYDLIQDPNSPYSNPIIRVGGMFGF